VSVNLPAHVLVVEDDPNLAAGVMENLRAEGYEVSVAPDGEQALLWLTAHGCALVILDVMLPGADGLTVCRTLRERGNTTPVLFLTARGDPADRVRGLEAGGDEVPPRPPTPRCCASAVTKSTSAPSARAPGTASPRSSPRRRR